MHDGNVKTETWLTPPEIITALGEFDLDPSSPINRPWDTAKNHFTIVDDGLMQEWFGRVWLNPPYTRKFIDAWIKKMSEHNNGIALLFARTDRNTFHNYVFPVADSMLFIKQRLHFYDIHGNRAKANAGAPSVLIGYGENNSDSIAECGIKGKHILLNRIGVVILGLDKSWRIIIRTALLNLNNVASVDKLYDEVEKIAPDKIQKNTNYKAKIRQVLQRGFERVNRGVYKNV